MRNLLRRFQTDTDPLRLALGSIEARFARQAPSMREAEFRAFSQFGEDGIIQWLIARVPIEHEIFIEFGVEDYRESNTRFLLEHDNWGGLILDAGSSHADFLEESGLRWRHTIEAVSAFITRDNINDLIGRLAPDAGILSIDIDGNDYWVWEAITAHPRIVAVEYNSVFGSERAVTVPYDAAFDRMKAHPSGLYMGASLSALCRLAERKGYRLIGSNSAGHNAFFVRDDVAGELPALTPLQAWRESRFRESREDGRLSYVTTHEARRALMADMPLVDIDTGATITVGELHLPANVVADEVVGAGARRREAHADLRHGEGEGL